MSELTKEKIYKSELIKGGATGNNNLERIRSLAGGGSSQKYIVEKVGEDNGKRRVGVTTLTANNLILSFGGAKYNPTYTLTHDIVIYDLADRTFTTKGSAMGVSTNDPIVLEFGGMFLFLVKGDNQLTVNAAEVSSIMGDGFEDFYTFDNIGDGYDAFLNGFIDGCKIYLLDSNYDLHSLDISADVANKGIALGSFTDIYYEGEKPNVDDLVYVDSWKIGTKIYVLLDFETPEEILKNEIYSFDTNGFVWKKEASLQQYYFIAERSGCLIGNDFYFISTLDNKNYIYKINSLNFKVTKLDVEGDFPRDSQLFDFNGEIGIAGGTGSNVHFVISKLTPKQ